MIFFFYLKSTFPSFLKHTKPRNTRDIFPQGRNYPKLND